MTNSPEAALPDERVEMIAFGDLVENVMASPDNPTRYGYFVRRVVRDGKMNPGIFGEVTDAQGKFWTSPLQNLNKISGDARKYVALLPAPSAWQGIEETLKRELQISSPYDHRSWVSIIAAVERSAALAQSPPGQSPPLAGEREDK